MAASKAVTKSDSDSALMPPPPQTKRQKRPAKILEEDVYTNALSHIIARDFFPGLLETEAQQEYLNALDSNNSDRIREAGRKLTQVMTPGPDTRSRRMARATSFTPRRTVDTGDTPRGFVGDTPARTPAGVSARDFASEVTPDVDVNMSLGAFQAKYTSEDNESFNELLDKQNASRAAKYAFFHHGNKIPSTNQIAYRSREQRLLESGERSTTSTALARTNAASGFQSTVSNIPRPSEDLDERTGSVDSFPSRQGPRNHLMFGPEGVEDTHLTYAQAAESRSNAPPKSVTYSATRMQPASTPSDPAVPPSPSMSAIDAAIAGRPRLSQSELGSEIDYSGAETPRVNGYAFVDAEPTPSELGVPVTDEEADAAEREAAMKFMPKAEEGGPNPFNIRERSKREDLHMRLVEKADATRRQERGGGGSQLERLRNLGVTPGRTPTPRFTSGPGKGAKKDSAAAMTPAARRLAGSIATPRPGGGLFLDGKDSRSQGDIWAPTPRPKRGA